MRRYSIPVTYSIPLSMMVGQVLSKKSVSHLY
jgi:hypothetical protein